MFNVIGHQGNQIKTTIANTKITNNSTCQQEYEITGFLINAYLNVKVINFENQFGISSDVKHRLAI